MAGVIKQADIGAAAATSQMANCLFKPLAVGIKHDINVEPKGFQRGSDPLRVVAGICQFWRVLVS